MLSKYVLMMSQDKRHDKEKHGMDHGKERTDHVVCWGDCEWRLAQSYRWRQEKNAPIAVRDDRDISQTTRGKRGVRSDAPVLKSASALFR